MARFVYGNAPVLKSSSFIERFVLTEEHVVFVVGTGPAESLGIDIIVWHKTSNCTRDQSNL
jgi:hypothetical protein